MKRRFKAQETNMDIAIRTLENFIIQNYKETLWGRFKAFFKNCLLVLFILLCVILVVVLIIMLIQNPLSLAILCGMILFFWIWGSR